MKKKKSVEEDDITRRKSLSSTRAREASLSVDTLDNDAGDREMGKANKKNTYLKKNGGERSPPEANPLQQPGDDLCALKSTHACGSEQ